MFKVGQKVVCINDAFNLMDCYDWEKLPVKGEIYTIREFVGNNHIRLVEIVNRAGYYRLLSGGVGFSESCFLISRFRSTTPLANKYANLYR